MGEKSSDVPHSTETMVNQIINEKTAQFKDLAELDQKDWKWISAKLASTYVAYYLLLHWGNKSNQVITHFINYAGSKTLDSSTYVKLGK